MQNNRFRVGFSRMVYGIAGGSMILASAIASPASAESHGYPAVGTLVPPSVAVRIRLDRAVSSATSRSGQNFAFHTVDAIRVDGRLVSRAGAPGSGFIVLAGHSGSGGHEGDLTLHIDTIKTVNGRILACDEQLELNGHKQGLLSNIVGFVPVAGMAASLIQGSNRTLKRGEILRVRFSNFAKVVNPAPIEGVAVRHTRRRILRTAHL